MPKRRPAPDPDASAPVDARALAPSGSYGVPEFVARGYYLDSPFRCEDCGAEQVWTAARQKWWYEVAKGYVYSTAKKCRPCRRLDREASDRSRRAHFDGLARKAATNEGGETKD